MVLRFQNPHDPGSNPGATSLFASNCRCGVALISSVVAVGVDCLGVNHVDQIIISSWTSCRLEKRGRLSETIGHQRPIGSCERRREAASGAKKAKKPRKGPRIGIILLLDKQASEVILENAKIRTSNYSISITSPRLLVRGG